jgi:hypothetical protein
MGPRRRPLSSGGASRSPERTPEGEDGGSGRRTAIWVAAITAVATVAAALVGVFAHGGIGEQSSPSAAPQSPRITPHESQSTSVQVTDFSVGQTATSRFVNVKGYVLALLGDNEIHAIAAPANGEPVERSGAGGAAVAHDAPTVHEVQRWYVSPPITLNPDGTWETRIDIDPMESRELTVEAIVVPYCYLHHSESKCKHQPPAEPAHQLSPPAARPRPQAPTATTPSPIPQNRYPVPEGVDWLKIYGAPLGSTTSRPVTVPVPPR